MKTIVLIVLFAMIAAFSWAADWETYEIVDRLLSLSGPGAPIIYGNSVIFTASSNLRKVGVAFAHENFSNVYWFRQLLIPQDQLGAPIPPGKKVPDPYKDSGIQFHVYQVPDYINKLEYRLIINGLWTVDPVNSQTYRDRVSGLTWSVLSIPSRPSRPDPPGFRPYLVGTFDSVQTLKTRSSKRTTRRAANWSKFLIQWAAGGNRNRSGKF